MDHALSGRIMSVCLWVYFLLGLLMVSANRFLTSRLIRLLAARMENLLKLSDYGWILSLGILAPTVYVFAISRFTSLGGRVWSVQEEVMLIPIAHFSALFLLMVGSSILAGRWRLQKRAGEFGFNDQRPWIGGTAILLAMTSVPAIGWVVLKELEEPFLIAAVSLLAPLLLWLLILAFRSPFGSSKNRLMSSMMTRVLMPVFGTGMLIAIILVPIFKAEEGYWFRRFSLAHFNVATAPVTEYEQLVAQKLGEEIREALGYE
ncbi:MAG: hypothetical protein EOP84_35255 [Verrucomicrobiaceae bacterium]|nr:MAG: hypothetical protein EOP84_35255 [Verrucomicrobiaceae bacterium]